MKTLKRVTTRGSSKSSNTNANAEGTVDTANIDCKEKAETTTKKTSEDLIPIKIRLLDDAQPPLEFKIFKSDTGQHVLNLVCEKLGNLVERDYFGLRFTDKHEQRQWIELDKSVYKQIKDSRSHAMSFRVKHYPANPIQDLKQELSRYLLYLQIRRDLAQGRLLCPPPLVGRMGALVAQAEFGDPPDSQLEQSHSSQNEVHANCTTNQLNGKADTQPTSSDSNAPDSAQQSSTADQSSPTNYLKKLKIMFNQTPKMENEIMQAHEHFCGLTPQEAEKELLMRASQLPTYGIDPFPVLPMHKITLSSISTPAANGDKTAGESIASPGSAKVDQKFTAESNASTQKVVQKNTPVYLGLTDSGIVTFVGLQRSQHYPWDQINRLACDGKQFLIYLKKEPAKTNLLSFRCESKAAALALWRWTIDRKCFFTLKQASEAKKLRPTSNLFSRSHTYRFSGKSQQELRAVTPQVEDLPQTEFTRVSSLRRMMNSYPVSGLNIVSGRATLPSRLRPALDTHDDANVANKENVSFAANDVTRLSSIPDTVMEQPQEEEILATTEAETSTETQPKTTVSDDEKGSINETAIQPVVITAQLVQSSHDSHSSGDTGDPGLSTEQSILSIDSGIGEPTDSDLRKRTIISERDTRHFSEYQRVVKTLDHTLDRHEPTVCVNTKQLVDEFELDSPVRSNGDLAHCHTNTVSAANNIYRPKMDEDLSKTEQCTTDRVNARNIVFALFGVCMMIGTVVLLEVDRIRETSPHGRQTILWRLADNFRRNPLIWAFDNYCYGPVRNRIVGSVLAIWDLLIDAS